MALVRLLAPQMAMLVGVRPEQQGGVVRPQLLHLEQKLLLLVPVLVLALLALVLRLEQESTL